MGFRYRRGCDQPSLEAASADDSEAECERWAALIGEEIRLCELLGIPPMLEQLELFREEHM
jgi:hypothetical protein